MIAAVDGLLACPACGDITLVLPASAAAARCAACHETYRRGRHVWHLIPPRRLPGGSGTWDTWEAVQQNGLVGYREDPDRNLSLGDRADCRQFAEFCGAAGRILDVGCGPQPWPAYFERGGDRMYVGVDPLADEGPSEFLKFAALAECLPFRANVFDHVLFSTTLDHFVDPTRALAEASRVAARGGEIDVWLGEKRPGAPRPSDSPDWYRRLTKPAGAEDLFHVTRLSPDAFERVALAAGLVVSDRGSHQVDAYRTNHFYRLTSGV